MSRGAICPYRVTPATATVRALLFGFVLSACAQPPALRPVGFAVDSAELEGRAARERARKAASLLREDPRLHLKLIGHADQTFRDDYNLELSMRRGNRIRDAILSEAPTLGDRISVEARGEWDPRVRGAGDTALDRNRRVSFVFYYPRNCPLDFSGAFLDCQRERLRGPPPEPSESVLKPVEVPVSSDAEHWRGGYVYGAAGYGILSGELVRHGPVPGVGAGWIWGNLGRRGLAGSRDGLRLSAGVDWESLIDLGFVWTPGPACSPGCAPVRRHAHRLSADLRMGVVRERTWFYLRLLAGVVGQQEESQVYEVQAPGTGELEYVTRAARVHPGGSLGGGMGVGWRLGRGLILGWEANTTAFFFSPAIYDPRYSQIPTSGAALFSSRLYLGWLFGVGARADELPDESSARR